MTPDDPLDFEPQEEFAPDFDFGPPKSLRRDPKTASREQRASDSLDHPQDGLRGDSTPLVKHSSFSAPSPWPDSHRVAPSEVLRCGLFGTARRGRGESSMRYLETNANVTLQVSGPELSQVDLDTWIAVVHLLRFGPAAELTRWSLLAAWPRARGATGTHVLRASLERLQQVDILLEVQNRRSRMDPEKEPDCYRYEGGLIDQIELDGWDDPRQRKHRNERAHITLSSGLRPLFENWRRTVLIPWHREATGDNPVALWFYGLIRSHRRPLPRPLLYYYRMSGSASSRTDFVRQSKRALSLLAEKRLIHSAELRRGMLFIERQRPAVSRKLPAEDTEWCVLAGSATRD